MWEIFGWVMLALGIICALHAVVNSRTSEGAVAWAAVLIAVPKISVFAYLFFGARRNRGYTKRRDETLRSSPAVWKRIDEICDRHRSFDKNAIPPRLKALEAFSDEPFTNATGVELLPDGETFFPALIAAIKTAKRTIDVQFYTFLHDEIGREVADALVEKAHQGVRVRLLYDHLGSHKTRNSFFRELEKKGLEVAPFLTSRAWWKRFIVQVNFRNHRKVVVIDDELVFLGGMNVADDYLSRNPKIGKWRDTQIAIRGAPAIAAKRSFLLDWHCSTGKPVEENFTASPPQGSRDMAVLIVGTGPVSQRDCGSLSMLNAINSAKNRLWIASPYFVPDLEMLSALQLAAARGVDVRVLTTKETDHALIKFATITFLDDLVPMGVKVFVYKEGLAHQKVTLVDDSLSYVGSMNFDNRSFRLNFEIGAWIESARVATDVEKMLEADFKMSNAVTRANVERTPTWKVLAGSFARLFAPAL